MSIEGTAGPDHGRVGAIVTGGAPKKGDLWGHPKGLYILFLTEMWERFSYYGMRALLVLYMTKYLFLPGHVEHVIAQDGIRSAIEWVFGPQSAQALSSQIYGLYTGFVYLTPVMGGIIADRYLGQRKTVIVGGVIMAIGHFVMAFSSLFYIALLLLIAGNGLFKPNISTQVGALYPHGDPRRDGAFNIFYVGINLGAFLSALVCGTLGESERFGWHYGFGAAGVGMVLGLILYLWGQKYLAPDNVMKRAINIVTKESAFRGPTEAVATETLVREKAKPFSREEWTKIAALVVLCLLNIPFWAVYEQQGNTLQLWADGNTNRKIFEFIGWGWEMPATWFQSINPFFIAALTPFINVLWVRQAKKGTEPSSASKMAIGAFFLGVSYIVMIGGARVFASGALASMWWLIGATFLATVGELYLSPVGLSLVTKISPVRIVSMMMGIWFLSSFAGNYLSGYLGTFWEKMSKESFFVMMGAISFGTGVAMVLCYYPLKKAIGDENAKPPAADPAITAVSDAAA